MTATLADLKAQREHLQAQRAEQACRQAEAQVVPRGDTLRAGLAVRDAAGRALDVLLERWLLDVAGLADETEVHHAMSLAAHEVLVELGRQLPAISQALPSLGESFGKGATPRKLLTVSQWSELNRWLRSGTNSPGPWRNELTPYLVEIQDALSEHSAVRQVTFIKSSGVGGTEAMYNWLGYVMHHLTNKDMLVVVPTLELRDRSFNPRLAKMLEETPVLSALTPTGRRDRANRAELLEYGARARVIKAGANSPDSLRSDHLPYVICDEVDAFPWDVGTEGDPMTLIENRQRTFSRAKTYCVSTPTLEGQSRIDLLYSRSDQRRYHVPCPHCNETQPLEFGTGKPHGLKWRTAPEEPGEPITVLAAWYVCQHCGAEIQEKHKPDMLAAGRWIAKRPARKLHRGYHLNALYAPTGLGLNWLKIAQKWVEVQGDTSELKAFVNTYLGEVWKEVGDSLEAGALLARLETYEIAALPVHLITGGADVQKDRIELTVVGWGAGEEAWVIDHLILPGDTTQPDVWKELHEALVEAGVHIACIDARYNTSVVLDFCEKRQWTVAIMGYDGAGRPLVEDERKRAQRLRARRKRARPSEPIGVDQAKTLIYGRLQLTAPGPGYIHFPNTAAFDDEYFAQLAAERLVTKVRGTRPFKEWVQLRPRNEALDCMNYNLAAVRLAPMLVGRAVSRAGSLPGAKPATEPPDGQPPSSTAEPLAQAAAESPAATLARIQRLRAQRRR
ncbi:phage terminase large subunit family protein [Pelomonas sp. Root1444]|uniref:phage terminase large subunit family protein n=1 Tax=Pelomonas sp. Root1444 TaxID=1736464 RepID=UPI0009E6635D|nr:terminase gpA endonuclease subunit [Pelomonas sp. Root1444]